MSRTVPIQIKRQLLKESRNQCMICGSKAFLQLAHIVPYHKGGNHKAENLLVLCPTCHMAVDSSQIPANTLYKVKQDWVEEGVLGKNTILILAQSIQQSSSETKGATIALLSWSEALVKSEEFDEHIKLISEEISNVKEEDTFIAQTLKPLFDGLGYEGVTILHHTGRSEHGKDMVFYERDRLGGFTFYAVVACIGKIHDKSSKAQTRDSGHYEKIIDQVGKCFELPYTDYNLKGDFYMDKVVVTCTETITDDALKRFRAWEDRERRHLIFLPAQDIAGHKLRLHTKHRQI